MLARLWLSTAVAAAVASGQLQSYRDFMACPDPVPAIVAHRANWHQLPENSVASIEDAIASGFDVVEIDVRRSADGQFFLLHDSTLDRTTETTGDPTTLTLAELTQIRLR
jgi:glycerophosphoryl diester phosphodiesterase